MPGMHKASKYKRRSDPGQVKGAVAIEFAIVFSVLFGLFYAIVSYALPLLMMQAFHAAASDGVRAAVSVAIEPEDDYIERVRDKASQVAENRIDWLQPLSGDRITVTVPDPEADGEDIILTVRITYPDYTDNPPVPILKLPFIGDVPRLPDTLAGTARVRL